MLNCYYLSSGKYDVLDLFFVPEKEILCNIKASYKKIFCVITSVPESDVWACHINKKTINAFSFQTFVINVLLISTPIIVGILVFLFF